MDPRMPKLQALWLFALILLAPMAGMSASDGADSLSGEGQAYSLSGKGWVTFRRAAESPDLPFVRDYVENMEFYEEAQEWGNWNIPDLLVGYHDLNDDGVPEMLLWFDVSGFFCGNSHCDLYIFQLQNGQWRKVVLASQNGVWLNDDKVQGWHTLYSSGSGAFLQWNGTSYSSYCTETPPAEIRLQGKIVCPTG
jgi:hypothetical protein